MCLAGRGVRGQREAIGERRRTGLPRRRRPAATCLALLRWQIYNLLIGNGDAHLKNLSFLTAPGADGMELAPHYDLLSTAVYRAPDWSGAEPVIPMGAARTFGDVRRADVVAFGAALGVPERTTLRQLEQVAGGMRGHARALVEAYEAAEYGARRGRARRDLRQIALWWRMRSGGWGSSGAAATQGSPARIDGCRSTAEHQGERHMRVRESTIEQELIDKLGELKYTLRPDIRDRAALEANFRKHFQALNRVTLTDAEYARLLDEIVTSDVFAAAHTLRHRNAFTRDDGTPLNYSLVNINDWCKNTFEVASQLRITHDYSHHRYDVMLLINGVPVVQIELKTLGIVPRRAIEQVVEYKADVGSGYARTLLCFLQLFVVSNRDRTYYFANNNARHFAFDAKEQFLPVYEYAAPDNRKITGLDAFADAFLAKCTLGHMISRYMVLVQGEQKLLMMRPYQIYAVKNIVECIDKNLGNGYVWHTTGSGKTLTSFKASTLLKANPDIAKCLFVVDRKDLDRQTREEFNRFQPGCVEQNTNTGALVERMLSDDAADKVIVCTIQKLGLALDEDSKRNRSREKRGVATYADQLDALRDKRIVFIFDECHRSQFGQTHQTIKEFFPKAQLFGFTGTPIFEENASYKRIEGEEQTLKTTEDLFEKSLHEYTITHAIEDRNVLRFHVDYFKPDGTHPVKPGETLAKRAVVEAILARHDIATSDRKFNAILATASINDAIEYHALFQTVQAEKQAADPAYRPLRVAAVFSPPGDISADVRQLQEDLPNELADNKTDPEGKKAALTAIIAGYNARFGTNHRIEEFDAYYQDVQKRIKDQQFANADLLPGRGRESPTSPSWWTCC